MSVSNGMYDGKSQWRVYFRSKENVDSNKPYGAFSPSAMPSYIIAPFGLMKKPVLVKIYSNNVTGGDKESIGNVYKPGSAGACYKSIEAAGKMRNINTINNELVKKRWVYIKKYHRGMEIGDDERVVRGNVEKLLNGLTSVDYNDIDSSAQMIHMAEYVFKALYHDVTGKSANDRLSNLYGNNRLKADIVVQAIGLILFDRQTAVVEGSVQKININTKFNETLNMVNNGSVTMEYYRDMQAIYPGSQARTTEIFGCSTCNPTSGGWGFLTPNTFEQRGVGKMSLYSYATSYLHGNNIVNAFDDIITVIISNINQPELNILGLCQTHIETILNHRDSIYENAGLYTMMPNDNVIQNDINKYNEASHALVAPEPIKRPSRYRGLSSQRSRDASQGAYHFTIPSDVTLTDEYIDNEVYNISNAYRGALENERNLREMSDAH